MTPLIRGLPDSLKVYAIQIQDRLRATTAGEPQAGPGLSWGETAWELINYGWPMGFVSKEVKSQVEVRRTETEVKLPRPPR